MQIYQLCTGEAVHCYQQSIVVRFNGKRRVLSTGSLNGGLRNDLTAVFNNDGTVGAGMSIPLLAPTYAEHLVVLANKLGLDTKTSTGFVTAAQMENVSIKSASHKELTVTAIVTGGVEINGARVGDPAPWDEFVDTNMSDAHGTINIMLFFNVDLTPDALVRSLVTCTEAKTAALQELMAASRYSAGLATGSGTDGTIIVSNIEGQICLENAGKHCKLGELIGVTVKEAVKEALFKQTGLNPDQQKNVLRRVERFGITADTIWEKLSKDGFAACDKAVFWQNLERIFVDDTLVTIVSLYVHLLDQLNWGLISPEAVQSEAMFLIKQILDKDASENIVAEIDMCDLVGALQQVLAFLIIRG